MAGTGTALRPWGAALIPVAGHPRGYTGKPHDSDTGLQDFQARWYSASIGRFHAIDPAGFTESNIHSFNRYAYANNNPYRFVDPDGRFAISTLVAAAVWAGGAAWTAYDTYNTYQEDGAAAAAGTVAVDGAITFAGGAITKGLFKGTQRTWRYFKRTDGVSSEVARGARAATGFKGSKGFELKNHPSQPVRNAPTRIGDRDFSGHALDQMQNRGITPSVVENAVKTGNASPGNVAGRTIFRDSTNNISVVTDSATGRVITVRGGR